METLEDLGEMGAVGGEGNLRLGLASTTQLPLWASPLAPRSYLKLK